MARIGIVFPGQGAQSPGMGQALYEKSAAARRLLDLFEKLRPGTLRQCFSGSVEELARTLNTQPCLFAVEAACAAALSAAGIRAESAAGFSLGEITALACSGAVDFEAGFRLVCRRAELMDAAAGESDAAMAAVLKLSREQVERLCRGFEHVWPVNYNCPGQITVSGLSAELDDFSREVRLSGGLAKRLKVSGAFHSPLMESAAQEFLPALEMTAMSAPELELYSNLTAEPYSGNPAEMRTLLSRQICSPVRWQETVEHMAARGIDTFIEAGPGGTLSGLIRRILPQARILSVYDSESLFEALEVLEHA